MQYEQIDVDYEDSDTKIAVSDFEYFHQLFFLMMTIQNNNDDQETHNFLKTYYMLEKVNAVEPQNNLATPVIILCDTGCGKTIRNNIEHLDTYEQIKNTDIILSRLNGIDKTIKRVCRLELMGKNNEIFPIMAIVPRDNIPHPPPESMKDFVQL